MNLAFASSPALAAVFARSGENPEAAPAEDQILMRSSYRALFQIWSNVHRQHINGTVDEAIFGAVVDEISAYSRPPEGGATDHLESRRRLLRWAWNSERFLFSADFQAFMEQVMGGGYYPSILAPSTRYFSPSG